MHRMGRGGSKMRSFEEFQESVEPLRETIGRARKIHHQSVSTSDWDMLQEVFRGIRVMASGTTVVGNSKVMAHLLPNIVPPVDREYTLKYLWGKQHVTIKNDLDFEWNLLRRTIAEFFIPVASDAQFYSLAQAWMQDQEKYPWDTSLFKVVDNLIIGARKA
jgi:hypothetical protein